MSYLIDFIHPYRRRIQKSRFDLSIGAGINLSCAGPVSEAAHTEFLAFAGGCGKAGKIG